MTRANTFAVWGKPKIYDDLTPAQRRSLARYVDDVVERCYRIAFDGGATAHPDIRRKVEQRLARKEKRKAIRALSPDRSA